MHINLLPGRVWIVPTFKTATSAAAARKFISSIFRHVGLPGVLVLGSGLRFTSALCFKFWTNLHAAAAGLGASLVFKFGYPTHHIVTTTVTTPQATSSALTV